MRHFLQLNQATFIVGLALSAALSVATPASAQTAASTDRPVSINKIAVVVNDEVITQQELDARVNAISRRQVAQGGAEPNREDLQKQVIERLISDRLQLQLAKENGMKVDDITLDRALSKMAEENKMTTQVFRNQIEKEGTTFAAFREEIRDEIALQRIREREVYSKIQASELEVDNYLAAEASAVTSTEEVNISHIFILIPENANAEQIKIRLARAQEIEKKIRAGEDFSKLALTYSDGTEGATGGKVGWRELAKLPPLFAGALAKVKEGEVTPILRGPNGFHLLKLVEKRTVTKSKDDAAAPTQSHVRHILMKVTAAVPAAEVRSRLAAIKKRIDSKTSTFEDEAKANSADTSASKGGDLGWIYPGDTVPQFEQAMNKLAINEVSDPVESPFGYHLIQVLERKTAEVSKDRQRNAARAVLRERKADEALQDWARQLRDGAYIENRLEQK